MERPLPHITKNGGKTIKCLGECEGHLSGRGLKLISKCNVVVACLSYNSNFTGLIDVYCYFETNK